jgi:hypothetical protein
MRDQLEHLLEMSSRPRVTIQVLPTDLGAHVGLLGAFMVASFPDDTPDMVYLEVASGRGEIRRNPETIAHMSCIYDALRDDALDARSSRDRIEKVMVETWTALGGSPATAAGAGATAWQSASPTMLCSLRIRSKITSLGLSKAV